VQLSAEDLYVFRHRVLREAAYQLLLPSQRADLHLLALTHLEKIAGLQVSVALARELAEHAGAALSSESELPPAQAAQLRNAQARLLRQWGELASQDWQNEEAAQAWTALANHTEVSEYDRADALLRAQTALALLSRHDDAGKLLQRCRTSLARLDSTKQSALLRCRERIAQAQLHSARAEMTQCELAAQQALELALQTQESTLTAEAESALASVARHTGRLQEAIDRESRALNLVLQTGGARAAAPMIARLGMAMREAGRNDDGAALIARAIEFARDSVNPRQLISALINGATTARAADHIDEAEAMLQEAMEISQRIGSRSGYATALGNYANLLQAARADLAGAEAAQLKAIAIVRELGTPNGEAVCLNNLAFTWFSAGLFCAAIRAWLASAELARRTNYALLEARARCFCAQALALLGLHEPARQEVQQGLKCLGGKDEGKFYIEFGAVAELTVVLANPRTIDAPEIAKRTLEHMESFAAQRGLQNDAYSRRTLDRVRRTHAELAQALAQGRPPIIVRGVAPADLNPAQRAALLDVLGLDQITLAPAVDGAMRQGLLGQPVPDWQDESRAAGLQLLAV